MNLVKTANIGKIRWQFYSKYESGLRPILEEIVEAEGASGSNGAFLSGEYAALKQKRKLSENPRFRLMADHPYGLSIYSIKASNPGLPAELWIKVSRPASFMEQARVRGKRTALEREWYMARKHEGMNIPVPLYLAFGRRYRKGLVMEEFLVQESLGLYQTFDRYYRYTFRPALPEPNVGKKRGLICELASLLRNMHDQGIMRTGIQPGQVLVASREEGLGLILTGLEEADLRPRWKKRPDLAERVRAMAFLDASFANLFNSSYRLRLFREYFRPDHLDKKEFSDLVKNIVNLSERISRARIDDVRKKISRRENPYYFFNTGSYRVYLKWPVYENSLIEILPALSEIIRKRGGVSFRLIGEARPVEAKVIACHPDRTRRNGWNSGAYHGMLMSGFLEERHLPQMETIAAAAKRSMIGGASRGGYIIIRKPDSDCLSLAEDLARKVADEFSGIAWDREYLVRLAKFLSRMHEMNMVYSPASGTDIWIRRSETKGREYLFGNQHNLWLRKRLSRREAAGHLAEFFTVLPISEADAGNVLKEYIRLSSRFRHDRDAFFSDFAEQSSKKEKSMGVYS